jgi:hypothetical protein
MSIDTKKKEMIGNFCRSGAIFCTEAQAVNDQDFNSFADGIACPHSVYDVVENTCYLTVETNKDTAEFSYENIASHRNR